MAISKAMLRPLERWLGNDAGPQSVTLALVAGGMTDSVVAHWPREIAEAKPRGDFAMDLLNQAEDHAQGVGREGRYFLKWLNAEGAVVVSMMWRAGEGLNMNLDGSVESQLAQLQRHKEAEAKINHQALMTLLEHYQEALAASQLRIRSLEEVRDAYELERLQKIASADTPAVPEETQLDKLAKTIEGFERVGNALGKAKLLGNGSTTDTPPTKKTETKATKTAS